MNIPTPCHIIDLDRLRNNLEIPIKRLRDEAQCNVLLALKGFSSDVVLPDMRDGLDGTSASGAYEARLGKEIVQKYVCTFTPAYQEHSICAVSEFSDAIVFNSVNQFSLYHGIARAKGCSCGLRINPEYSELPEDFGPNPCQPFSRLGVKLDDMPPLSMFELGKIEGLHIHTMCEQGADALERTVNVLREKFDPYLRRVRWLNLGGGQMYAQNGYDLDRAISCLNALHKKYDFEVYLEPCEGIVTDCGYFAVTVVDIVHNEMDIAIVDGSGICHMPDAVYRGWRHDVRGADEPGVYRYAYRLTGPSCYAGDIWGDYSFPSPLKPGDKIMFEDTAAYSMVKNNMFNGLPMPAVAVKSEAEGFVVKKKYGYEHFIDCV